MIGRRQILALLAVGVPVQVSAWETLPVWYHLVFLAALVPFSVVGAWLRDAQRAGVASS